MCKIGILAGCMNNQKGVSRDELYHNVLLKLLSANKPNVAYRINLSAYSSYDRLLTRSIDFLEKNNPDIFCLFIRHFPLFPLHKPLIKYEKEDGNTGWALHPSLFNRQFKWNKKLTEFQSNKEFVFVKRNKIELRDINLLFGMAMGLPKWAFNYIWEQIMAVKSICGERDIKFIIVSPVGNPESLLGDIICKRIGASLEKHCNEVKLKYVNISTLSINYYEKDKVHLNSQGHEFLGTGIYEQIIKSEQTNHSQSPLHPVSTKATLYSAE
jgi:hypothetical protein